MLIYSQKGGFKMLADTHGEGLTARWLHDRLLGIFSSSATFAEYTEHDPPIRPVLVGVAQLVHYPSDRTSRLAPTNRFNADAIKKDQARRSQYRVLLMPEGDPTQYFTRTCGDLVSLQCKLAPLIALLAEPKARKIVSVDVPLEELYPVMDFEGAVPFLQYADDPPQRAASSYQDE